MQQKELIRSLLVIKEDKIIARWKLTFIFKNTYEFEIDIFIYRIENLLVSVT